MFSHTTKKCYLKYFSYVYMYVRALVEKFSLMFAHEKQVKSMRVRMEKITFIRKSALVVRDRVFVNYFNFLCLES